MNNGVSLNDFSNYSSEASYSATFVSEVAKSLQTAYSTESARLNAVADAFAKDFQKYSDTAQKYADRAAQAGNTKAKDLFDKISSEFSKASAERSYMDSQKYVEKLANDAKAASSGLAKLVGPLADSLSMGAGALEAASTGNTSALGEASAGSLGGAAGAALGTALVGVLVGAGLLAGAAGLFAGVIVGVIAVGGSYIAQGIWGLIDPNTKTAADAAKAALPPRRDPLIFDLNGDGLSTIGISATNPILFDHNADGIKTGTGWVKPDDAFLVLDKNGNGTIDNGRELFGDATLKSNGQLASNGFDALADLDSIANGGNADGIINSSDTQYANLRLWRDLNQDGISQTGELFSLASQNIIGINVASNAHSQILPNGNQLADTGSFIKADGTQGEVGAVTGNLGDINLASDTFHRSFTDTLDTTAVQALPDMQGSGKVRDLREAANDEDWRVVV